MALLAIHAYYQLLVEYSRPDGEFAYPLCGRGPVRMCFMDYAPTVSSARQAVPSQLPPGCMHAAPGTEIAGSSRLWRQCTLIILNLPFVYAAPCCFRW